MGCYYHGCDCQQSKLVTPEAVEKRERRRDHDQERRNYIHAKGYKLEEMWECQWRAGFQDKESDIYRFVKKAYCYKRPMTAQRIVQRVSSG